MKKIGIISDTHSFWDDSFDKYFFENYIIQSIIHINIYDPKNITGTTSDIKFNLYRIFDNFMNHIYGNY